MTKLLKMLCALFLCAFFTFSGCGDPPPRTSVAGFSAEFSGEFNSVPVEGSVCYSGRGLLSLDFKKPESLSRLQIEIKNSVLTLKSGALACTADEAYLPATSLARIVKSCLETDCGGAEEAIHVQLSGGEYILRLSENGLPLSLDGGRLSLSFENATFL